MELSRRNFLVGAGVAAGALATAGLVGCSSESSEASESSESSEGSDSEGLSSADTTTGSGDGGRWSWSTAPAAIEDSDIAETYDCEICVVGLGVSGGSALTYAAKQGYDTVALQKIDHIHPGGKSFGAFNSERGGEEMGLDWDIEHFVQLMDNATNGRSDLKLVRKLIENSGPVAEWFEDNIEGAKITYRLLDDDHLYCKFDVDDFESDYENFGAALDKGVQEAQELGATVLYNTPAVQLVTDDNGDVTGVIGQAEDGSYVKVTASKGVILCTGGFDADDEMIECYIPFALGLTNHNSIDCNTGDGTKMGMWAGAAIESTPASFSAHLDLVQPAPFRVVPWLHVNENTERFSNENVDYECWQQAVMKQPHNTAYQIFDSRYSEHLDAYVHAFQPKEDELPEALEAGTAWTADTIPELAEAVGLDPDKLQEVVDRYNGYVDAGIDEEFGVDPEILVLNGIKEPPFYCCQYTNCLVIAEAGLVNNENFEVLNTDGDVIKGLYTAGNMQGSVWGYNFITEHFKSFACGRAATGGVLAVKAAMGTLDDGEI